MRRRVILAVIVSFFIVVISTEVVHAEETLEEIKPEGMLTGGYIESELDYNTPVYESMMQWYREIPVSYPSDMDTYYNTYPDVRNQNPYGTCWAFSTIGLAEYDLINDGYFTKENDLSELELAYFTFNSVVDPLGGTEGDESRYYNWDGYASYLNYGGNYQMAISRMSQWVGVVKESDVPYSYAYSTIYGGLDNKYAYDYDVAHLENAFAINIRQNVLSAKEQIMEHGAVGVMYYHLDSALQWNNEKNAYTYYDTSKAGGGHAVMIVGWDDNFSRDYFAGDEKPTGDGAWLVRNSWGNYCAYFWMSYETSSLADSAWVFDFAANDKYDNNYQYDGGLISYPASYTTMANVFTVHNLDTNTCEELSAVSLSLMRVADVSYTIEVYTDLTNPKDPTSGIKQEEATTSGTTEYAGFYTIPLEKSVNLNSGSMFSIVVTVDKKALDCEEAISYVDMDNNITLWECSVSLYNGKSFYKSGNRFGVFPGGNLCVKAFTSNTDVQIYSIDYELNGGENNQENPACYQAGNETILLRNPNKSGYLFAGWYLDPEFQIPITEIPANGTQNYILYAKWEKDVADTTQKGWVEREGATYYYNENGNVIIGWNTIEGARYYFQSDGKLYKGWLD